MVDTTPLLQGGQVAFEGALTTVSLGVLSEGYDEDPANSVGDQRVSIVPAVAAQMIKDGYKVNVESGAGRFAGFSDVQYQEVNCVTTSRQDVIKNSDVLFAIDVPERDFQSLNGKIVISWVGRLTEQGQALVKKANDAGVILIDVTAVPRITIAQKLDVLSSQAKVAGHRAVIEATHSFGRFHTAEMTAAGKYPPSQTFVLGCGVAGLAAIGTSRALGSVVRAWDVRDVSDQCQSMGAKWVTVDFKEDGAGQGGYARESSDAFKAAQQETFRKTLQETDIAITTAAIPGRRSPLLITKEAVAGMKPGSVIVDLAAVGGGNCELTKLGESIVTPNGVTIIGYSDLPARMANQASAMYAQNMANLLKHVHGKDGACAFVRNLNMALNLGEDGDIVARSIVCCRNGALLKAPSLPQPTPIKPKAAKPVAKVDAPRPFRAAVISMFLLAIGIVALLCLGEGVYKHSSLLTTFLLAGAAGYLAVWGVAHALHTPLMSVTNAISGMTAVGGLLLLNKFETISSSQRVDGADILAMIAIAFSAVNIVGGFVVSQRMLNLFKKQGEEEFSAMLLLPGLLLIAAPCWDQTLIAPAGAISGLLCVAAIGGLASMSSANAGCKFGIIGVAGSLAATLVKIYGGLSLNAIIQIASLGAVGGVVGLIVGLKVSPMALPQTVAGFHSLVGLAAMCTSIGSYQVNPSTGVNLENVAVVLGDFIGGVTLTGSIIAFGKLNGNLSSKPLNLFGKNYLNLTGLAAFIALSVMFLRTEDAEEGALILWGVALLSMIMGWHLVGSVGGGDMPVCITVLNSYSGWALVAEGFCLASPVLTVVGSLIGFSGAILTKIMCDAMNRDIFNVLFGGMNNAPVAKGSDDGPKEHVQTSVVAVADMLVNAKEVLCVPGYGMAMASAQGAMGELSTLLREHKINMKFGVHPVAGRMPGQMNVLLAEARVPHDWVFEMDEVNPDMENNDVVLIVGANDVVNSAAQEVEGCAIWGMPVIEVWRSKKVIFCKRSMSGGYADLDNPVFYKPNTEMLFGDAKKTAEGLAAEVRKLFEAV
jgi:NAD(P) transhydrogenase